MAQQALQWSRPRFGYLQAWPLAHLARLSLLKGDIAAAERFLAESQLYYTPNLDLITIPVSNLLAAGEVALAAGRYPEALAASDQLMAYLSKTHTRPFVPDALLLRAQTLLAQHEEAQVHTVLEEARASAEALGSRRTLWHILALRGDLEAAREHITFIADHISRPALRSAFLALPAVRTLLDPT
jgi:ATP/maltotriose-dependent transcriptional regulator MalT